MTDNMDDFVQDMEEDILNDDNLDDMIPEDDIETEDIMPPKRQPPRQMMPKKVKMPTKGSIYQEQFKVPPRVETYIQPVINGNIQNNTIKEKKNLSLDKLKSMVNFNTLKMPLLVLIIFIILSMPQFNDLLGKYINFMKPDEQGKQKIIVVIVKGVFLALVVLVMSKLFSL